MVLTIYVNLVLKIYRQQVREEGEWQLLGKCLKIAESYAVFSASDKFGFGIFSKNCAIETETGKASTR